jgi:adenosylmethionine-8-amino-7-oxononanoate aminotransferase
MSTPHDTTTSHAQLSQWDLDHVWHPFTQAEEWEADAPPLIIDRAEGAVLFDVHGERYLDGISSLWTNVHGHQHPEIDKAITEQLARVAHSTLLGLASTPSIVLARKIAGLLAGIAGDTAPLTRTFYSDSGSTAVEIALKMAFQWQQQTGHPERTRFAALQSAYHGDTIGSVSVGGIDLFHAIYRPMLFDAVRIPAPDRADPEIEAEMIEQARVLFATHGSTLAALIVEPLVQGAAGMRMHSPAFLRTLIELARSNGALVIVDEVATGFGRTGTLFAMEQVGVRPDIICLAKGLTGGYLPLAATVTTDRVYDAFRGSATDHRTFFHGHTYTGNALACAAAIASIDAFQTDALLDKLPGRIAALREALQGLPSAHVAEIRQHGLMAGVVLRHDHPPNARHAHRVCMRARSYGVVLRPLGDVIVLMPPLAMTCDQIREVVAALAKAMVAA